jgi:hypothetical protein
VTRRIAVSATTLLLASLALTSCTRHWAEWHADADVMLPTSPDRAYLVPGHSEILVYRYERMHLPLPDAFSGFTLFVILRPDLVKPGAALTIPQPGAQAVVSRLRAPLYESADDLTGSIAVKSVGADEIVARVNVRSASLHWSYAGSATFTAPLAAR